MSRRVPFLQVDAFTDQPFAGNPAAVVRTDEPLSAELMQAIALENNLSETAFVVPQDVEAGRWSLRWFTPTTEVELCGHATLGWTMSCGSSQLLADIISRRQTGIDPTGLDMSRYAA